MKKEYDLLRSGLTSEYFLLLFIKRANPYQIAKIIKNTEGIPDVSKIYPTRDILVDSGYVELIVDIQGDKHYRPNYKKLAEAIAYLLGQKGESLCEDEQRLLTFFLKNSRFMKFVSDDVVKKLHSQKKGEHNLDALEIISNKIGEVAAYFWVLRYLGNIPSEQSINLSSENLETQLQQLEEEWKKICPRIIEVTKPIFLQKIKAQEGINPLDVLSNVTSDMPGMLLFVPVKTVEKLTKLAATSDIMHMLESLKEK